MCGIFGFAGFEDKTLLNKMSVFLKHRGPDESGSFIDKNISLGHRRLAIIDLKTGKQPIHNEKRDIWIVFNGEIYNYKELRQDLEKNHDFYTESDTEVIIHAYEKYGEEFINYLNGEFAFAIWDSNKKQLILARDRLGVKPLYYFFSGGKIIFASEIKAILQNKEIKRQINKDALDSYLAFRCNFMEETFFKGIYRLEPGCILIYKNKSILKRRYWDLKMNPENLDKTSCEKQIFNIIEDSIKKRMMSEVPFGAYISGGIDSGIVVGLMSKFSKEAIKTFSVGFGIEKQVDELKYAKIIAEHFNTDHHEIIVEPHTARILPKIIYHFDEPIADPAAIPTYLLSEKTKQFATVVQTGEGGDEVFAGYPQYKFMMLKQKIPFFIRKISARIITAIPKKILNQFFAYSESLGEKGLDRFRQFISAEDYTEAYMHIVSIFNENERKDILGGCKKINFKIERNYLLNSLLLRETKTTLPENLLMKVDKMTMAHAIEARVPLLDYRLVEFASKIPEQFKLRGLIEKYILRQSMKSLLPKSILNRRKHHFFVPIDEWFNGELKELAQQYLDQKLINEQGIFDYNYIEKIFSNFDKSKLFYSRQLWTLLTFQIWYNKFIK